MLVRTQELTMKMLAVLTASTSLMAGGLFLSGCDRGAPEPTEATNTPSRGLPQSVDDGVVADTATVDRYEGVRGRITAVPIEDSPTVRDLRIHHESMPNFKGKTGKLGMNAMTMPFPLGEGVTLEDFAIGDAVQFDFEVDWEASPPYWVTAMRKLPADAKLEFEKAADHSGHDHGEDDGHDHGGGG